MKKCVSIILSISIILSCLYIVPFNTLANTITGTNITYNFEAFDEGTVPDNWRVGNTEETEITVSNNKTIVINAKNLGTEESPRYDPIIYTPDLNIEAIDYDIVNVGLKWSDVEGGVNPEVYFLTDTQTSWSAGAYYQTSIANTSASSEEISIFSFDMSSKIGWTGTITNLRIDPGNNSGTYELAYVEFVNNGVKIIYDANGGQNPPEKMTNLNDGTYILSAEAPVREGYRFVGWASVSDAAAADIITDITISGEDVVVYAVWEIEQTQSLPCIGFASEFKNHNDLDGWNTIGGILNYNVENGVLYLETKAVDARLQKTLWVSESSGEALSSDYSILKIRYRKNDGADSAKLRWQRTIDAEEAVDVVAAQNANRVQILELTGENNVWTEQFFDLSANENWNGDIRTLWLDAVEYDEASAENPGVIEYDYIRFYRKGDLTISYNSNIAEAVSLSGNTDIEITNVPAEEVNVAKGNSYIITDTIPTSSDDSIYFAGWSITENSNDIITGNIIDITEDIILYAIWQKKAVVNADYPTKKLYPNGIKSISDYVFSDVSKNKLINTGFEKSEEINQIRENNYAGRISITDDAYAGRFSLNIRYYENSELLPLKSLLTDDTSEAALFVVSDEPDNTSYIRSSDIDFIETPLSNESTNTGFADIENANLLNLYIKPKQNAEEISFYVQAKTADGTDVYVKIISDTNNDGIFKDGEDFTQGKWSKLSLDLLNTEQIIPSNMIYGIFVAANSNSEWSFDDLSSENRIIDTLNANLEAFEKDNLICDNGILRLDYLSDDSEKYNISPVISSAEFPVDSKISKIVPDITYYDNSFTSINSSVSPNLLPFDVLENSEYFETLKVYERNDTGNVYYEIDNGGWIKIKCNNIEPGLYKMIMQTSTYNVLNIFVNSNNCFSSNGTYNTPIYCVLPITAETDEILIKPTGYIKIYDIDLVLVNTTEMNKGDVFSSSNLITHQKANNTQVTYEGLPFIEDGTYSGTTGTIDFISSSTDYTVVTVINPSYERMATMTLGDQTYTLHYGKWDYVFTGQSLKKIIVSDNGINVLVTEIKRYRNYLPNDSADVVTTGKNGLYGKNANIIYYIDDYNIYAENLTTGEIRKIHSSESTDVKLNLVSPRGNCLYYTVDSIYKYIYSYDTNSIKLCTDVHEISVIDDLGNYYGLYKDNNDDFYFESNNYPYQLVMPDEISELYVNADGSRAFVCSGTKNIAVTVKNDGDGWFIYNEITFPKESKLFFDEISSKIYAIIPKTYYQSTTEVEYPNSGNQVINLEDFSMNSIDFTPNYLSTTINGNMLISSNNQVHLFNPVTEEKELLFTGVYETPIFYNEDTNNLIFNTDGKICVYSTVRNETIVKMLLSFDGMTTWKTFKNGNWMTVANAETPSAGCLQEYGMTASEIENISEDNYAELYKNGSSIYSAGIAMQVSSKTNSVTPEINNIFIQTVKEDENKYLYTAKANVYDKNDYSAIKAIYANELSDTSDECYYFLCLGNEWLYTYKDNTLMKMQFTADELFGNVQINWFDIRQYGMDATELRSVPEDILTKLLVNDLYANDTFTLAYCIKTDKDSTSNITTTFNLEFDRKYGSISDKTIKITLSSDIVISLTPDNISASEAERFMNWLEAKQLGRGSAFFKLISSKGMYFINYYMIKSVEICE